MKQTIITIDTNDHTHVGNLKWDGAITMVKSLQFGDLHAICDDGSAILIERKNPSDFLESMRDNRLMNQIAGMVKSADFAYLVVCGGFFPSDDGKVCINSDTIYADKTGWQWHSLQGQLASIQELGCTIWYEPNYHEAVRLILNRSRSNIKIPARREPYIYSQAETLLMAIPGIGGNKASEIMKQFPTVGYALEWLSDPGLFEPKIEGIASGIKQKVNEFFGGKLEVKL